MYRIVFGFSGAIFFGMIYVIPIFALLFALMFLWEPAKHL